MKSKKQIEKNLIFALKPAAQNFSKNLLKNPKAMVFISHQQNIAVRVKLVKIDSVRSKGV